MNDEEFDDYYLHGFKGGHRMNRETKDVKTRFFESYTYNNGRWKETTLDRLKYDISDLSEVKKDSNNMFWWVEKKGRDYYINCFPLVGVLFDHREHALIYATPEKLIHESAVFSSEEECRKWIYDEEESHHGEITIMTKEQVEAQEQARKAAQEAQNMWGNQQSFTDENGVHKTFSFRFG